MALTLDDLHVRIGRLDVLAGVTLRVEPGCAVGLVGETGSGKTMTARAACGLLGRVGGRVTRGTIVLDGRDVTDADERTWRRLRGRTVALVPQSSMSGLDPVMPIGRQLRETVRMLNRDADPTAETTRLLADVLLEPDRRLLGAYPHELSGGMRQRAMIALDLAGDPSFIVADEPTTALDSTIRHEILDLLGDLRRERGLGLLIVSHDLGVIAAATDTTVVMYGGRTVEAGPTDEVLATRRHPYTQALLDALPERARPGRRLRAIPGQPPTPGELGPGCPFSPRCPHAQQRCATVPPRLSRRAAGHDVACLLDEPQMAP